MKQHGVIKFQPGQRANCSSMDYLWVPMVAARFYMIFYAVALLVAVFAAKWLRNEKTAIRLWVGINIIVTTGILVWASTTGMMNYGTIVCVIPMIAGPLLVTGIAIPLLRRVYRAHPTVEQPIETPPDDQQAETAL